jgi:large subunit ribosomal protein L25
MEIIKLSATRREETGKGSSRRLRRIGHIPAVAYGKNLAALQVAVSPKALLDVLGSEHGQNAVLELAIENGEKLTVMVRDYAYHPVTRSLIHADFVQVKLDQPVDVEIPLRCTGKSKGVVAGGILQQIFRRIPVRCLPERIPAAIDVDISELDMGDSIKAGTLSLGEGIKVRLSDDQTIVVVNVPEKPSAEEEAAAAAAVPGAAPVAGAPVAGAPVAGAPVAGAPVAGAPAAAPAKGGAPAAKGGAPAAKAAAAPAAKAAAPAKGGKDKK